MPRGEPRSVPFFNRNAASTTLRVCVPGACQQDSAPGELCLRSVRGALIARKAIEIKRKHRRRSIPYG